MVPVGDLESDGWERELVRACERVGFVALSGHGIDPALIECMRRLTTEVFALDERTKAQFRISPSDYRGFIPLGFFTPNRSEINGRDADRYEGFKLHWECPPDHPAASACAFKAVRPATSD